MLQGVKRFLSEPESSKISVNFTDPNIDEVLKCVTTAKLNVSHFAFTILVANIKMQKGIFSGMQGKINMGSDDQAYIFWWLVLKYGVPAAKLCNIPGLESSTGSAISWQSTELKATAKMDKFASDILGAKKTLPNVEEYFLCEFEVDVGEVEDAAADEDDTSYF